MTVAWRRLRGAAAVGKRHAGQAVVGLNQPARIRKQRWGMLFTIWLQGPAVHVLDIA